MQEAQINTGLKENPVYKFLVSISVRIESEDCYFFNRTTVKMKLYFTI